MKSPDMLGPAMKHMPTPVAAAPPPPPPAPAPAAPPAAAAPAATAGPAAHSDVDRRGDAHRRLRAFETDEGITVLSNRAEDMALAARTRAAPRSQPMASLSPVIDEPVRDPADEVTETRALRRHREKPNGAAARSERSGFRWPMLGLLGVSAAGAGLWFLKRRRASA